VKGLPAEYQGFMEHLQNMQYQDKPDYKYLYVRKWILKILIFLKSLLQDMLDRAETPEEQQTPLDVQLSVNVEKKAEPEASPRAFVHKISKSNVDSLF
jgi:hypothetical protein